MADQLPIISGTRAINATGTASNSLIGRGLSAIQNKGTDLARPELNARYRQARDIYNSILDCFADEFDCGDIDLGQTGLFEVSQFPFFIEIRQQLTNVFTVFQQLADQGYGKAYFPLANMYKGWQGISENRKKSEYYGRLALDWCNTYQDLNDPEIWVDLGWMYFDGCGVEEDYEQAVFWYRKAAEQGNTNAQYKLGNAYFHGWHGWVEQNDELAAFWFRKAAEQDNASAQHYLGCIYGSGEGVEQDSEQAAFWYRKAAEQGHTCALACLGWSYAFAEGVEQDDEQAVFWLHKAAEQGHLTAENSLDWIYAKIICRKDCHKSILMERFGVTDIQAEAILELKLRLQAKLKDIQNILDGQSFDWYVFVSHFGYGFRVQLKELSNENKTDKLLITLLDDTKALKPLLIRSDTDILAVVTLQARLMIFPVTELSTLAKNKNNKLIQISVEDLVGEKDYIVSAVVLPESGALNIFAGKRHLILKGADIKHYSGSHGQRGLFLPRGFQKVDRLECKIYQVRRFDACGSSMSSYEDIAQFPDLNAAEILAENLFLNEYGSDRFAPLRLYESLASYFDVDIPKDLAEDAGFPISLLADKGDIDELLEKWWGFEEQLIYPCWEILSMEYGDISGDGDVESISFISPMYSIDDNRIFIDINEAM
ncbi:MAG: hypothetical protein ACXW1U_18885 [Methylobacter sp.]